MMELLQYIQTRLNVKSERGAALVEYALLLALIAVVCIVAVGVIGTEANKEFTEIGGSLSK